MDAVSRVRSSDIGLIVVLIVLAGIRVFFALLAREPFDGEATTALVLFAAGLWLGTRDMANRLRGRRRDAWRFTRTRHLARRTTSASELLTVTLTSVFDSDRR